MTDALESLGRVRTKALLLLGTLFVAGGVAGVAFDRLVLRPATTAALGRPNGSPFGGSPFGGPPAFVLRGDGLPPMLESLGLTDTQRARAREIVAAVRPRIDSLTRATVPPLRALTDSVRFELEGLLTPKQRALLNERLPFGRGRPPRGGPPSRD